MSKEEVQLRFVSEDKVPRRVQKRKEEYVKLFRSIPKGQALVLTEKDLGVSLVTVRYMVSKLKREKLLGQNYYATRRTVGGKETLYVVNSAKVPE